MSEYTSGVSISAPATAPSGTASATGGSLSAGNYLYKVSYITVNGETLPSSASSAITATLNGIITLTIPTGTYTNITGRKIYRTQVGGTSYTLLATISNNTATTYIDTASDASISATASPKITSTAVSVSSITGIFKTNDTWAGTVTNAITASTTQTQAGGVLLTSQYNIVSVCANANDAVTLPAIRVAGEIIWIKNNGANTLQVFPNVGHSIGAGGANASTTLATTVRGVFIAVSTTLWMNIA